MLAIIMNEQIQLRIQAIIDEYSQLPQSEFCEPPVFEVLNEEGDIKMTLAGTTSVNNKKKIEKLILSTDDLSTISDIFTYPEYIGRLSKEINADAVRVAYLDHDGYLIVEYKDERNFGSTERFKIKEKHREEIIAKLKNNLGKKLKV
jgi:hypothetical protein